MENPYLLILIKSDVKDTDIMNIANALFDNSEQLPSEKSKRYANEQTAHIINDYSLLNNNCTTFVSDLINKKLRNSYDKMG